MHELGITQEIVAIVLDRVGAARVRRVVLQIGKLTCVLPDAVRFAFEVCSQDTPLEGAELEILETPGKARCRDCAAELELEQPFGRCPCGCCDLEWLSGDELKIKSVEIA